MKYFKLMISMIVGKFKASKADECPDLLAQWETTEEAAEVAAEMLRQDSHFYSLNTEVAVGGVSYATMHDWDEYYSELREQIEWAQAQEKGQVLSCGVRIRWAQAINSYDQWHVEEEAEVFSMASLPSAMGCSLFLGNDWPNLEFQRWELERALEKWVEQVPAAADRSRHFTDDDELAWSQAMFDQWMHDCQLEEQAAAEAAYLALDTEQAWPDPPSEGLQSPCLAEPKAKS
jgi:hypothetical protein